ncbi:MAG TPA: DUF1176 domain-containing protein [Rhizobiales bacterium]|nr:DUF1176 domain-containing protein [Hyphomicrobiales bacterium]
MTRPVSMALALAVAASLAQVAAASADAPYLDDRSDAAALVRSFYNAVNRREYARAWDYFGETKPSKSFEAFAAGYAKTERVDVVTGTVATEGAAGSAVYFVPVAISAVGTDGEAKVFAGCYRARLANPQVQGVPFRPLHLEKGSLKPAEGELADALPESCPDGPPVEPRDAVLERVAATFRAAYAGTCQTLEPDAEPDAAAPEIHEIGFRYSYDGAADEERKARLFRFTCGWGAYNTNEVYYLADDAGEISQLQFAQPELDIRYEDGDDDRTVKSMRIVGYSASDRAVNSFYDPGTRTITTFSKWRGVGDASSSGLYLFRDGRFTLVKYEVDASYDEEINPETVLDFETAP